MGVQVGTAIATLVRKADHAPAEAVGFRHLWGQAKREALLETAEASPDALYARVPPLLPLGLPFVRTAVGEGAASFARFRPVLRSRPALRRPVAPSVGAAHPALGPAAPEARSRAA